MLVRTALADRDSEDERPVVILAADEGRFGRRGQVMRAWCAPGIRPDAAQQWVRENLYAFVAVAPSLGRMSALGSPFSNTAMVNLFLEQGAEDFADFSW